MLDLEKLERDCLRYARYPDAVLRRDRAWRAKERAANVKPVSDKVAFYNPRVDATPAVKPRGRVK